MAESSAYLNNSKQILCTYLLQKNMNYVKVDGYICVKCE